MTAARWGSAERVRSIPRVAHLPRRHAERGRVIPPHHVGRRSSRDRHRVVLARGVWRLVPERRSHRRPGGGRRRGAGRPPRRIDVLRRGLVRRRTRCARLCRVAPRAGAFLRRLRRELPRRGGGSGVVPVVPRGLSRGTPGTRDRIRGGVPAGVRGSRGEVRHVNRGGLPDVARDPCRGSGHVRAVTRARGRPGGFDPPRRRERRRVDGRRGGVGPPVGIPHARHRRAGDHPPRRAGRGVGSSTGDGSPVTSRVRRPTSSPTTDTRPSPHPSTR